MSRCASCGSERLLRRTPLVTPYPFGGAVFLGMPKTLVGTRQRLSEIRALTCVDCGYVQIHATDLAVLRDAFEHQQKSMLHVVPEGS